MPRRGFPVLAALSLLPRLAAGQVPAGAEFQVNTYTTGFQTHASVAADAAGNFVVAWGGNYQDGHFYGIFARPYSAAGTPQGPAFVQVNSYTTGNQSEPSVASDVNGNLVFVWHSNGQDGSDWGVYGQRFNAAGAPVGGEFRANTHTTSTQRAPRVASDADGDFVVAWQSLGQEGVGYHVFARRYDAVGTAIGAEFRVAADPASNASSAAVASDADGAFVVVWVTYEAGPAGFDVFARRFDPAGAAIGADFRVNTHTVDFQSDPDVAFDGDGNFVVAWSSKEQDGAGYGVFGQRYDATGVARGSEFQVNGYTTGHQYHPSVARDGSGSFVVTWTSQFQDGSNRGIFGKRYDRFGMPEGGDFQVNSFTNSTQINPSVAPAVNGNFVVAWQSSFQDGSFYGIFGQRFRPDVIFKDGFQAP